LLRAAADRTALLLGRRRANVQRERIDVLAQRDYDERDLLRHQGGDERHVTAEPVELGNGDFAPALLCRIQRCLQFRPSIQRITAFPGLDLAELSDDFEAFRGSKSRNRLALSLKAEPRTIRF
jgi:hypothetical protein